jgi:spermidine synthase
MPSHRTPWLYALSMLVMGGCGMIYEYLLGVLGNDLIGSRYEVVLLVVGVMLFAMGLGSALQQLFVGELLDRFLLLEITLGLVGGTATTVTFALFALDAGPKVALYLFAFVIGLLVGMEIPLLLRLNEEHAPKLEQNLSAMLSLDYLGGLCGALLFVTVLLTRVSLPRIGFVLGLANTLIGIAGLVAFRRRVRRGRLVAAYAAGVSVLLLVGALRADAWAAHLERYYFEQRAAATRPPAAAPSTPEPRSNG